MVYSPSSAFLPAGTGTAHFLSGIFNGGRRSAVNSSYILWWHFSDGFTIHQVAFLEMFPLLRLLCSFPGGCNVFLPSPLTIKLCPPLKKAFWSFPSSLFCWALDLSIDFSNFNTVFELDKLTSSILHLYFIAHLQHLRVNCMDVSNHTIRSWQLHMTSEILYTYIWRTEEVIKPYGPLPYSRKHSTNLLTWFIITLCHLAKPTLQLFERNKPSEKEREDLHGELQLRQPWAVLCACSHSEQWRPHWQHRVWASGVQTPQFGWRSFLTTRKTNGSVLSLHIYLWFCSAGKG